MIASPQKNAKMMAPVSVIFRALTSAKANETPAIAPVTKIIAPRPKYLGRSVGQSARTFRLAPDSQIKMPPILAPHIVCNWAAVINDQCRGLWPARHRAFPPVSRPKASESDSCRLAISRPVEAMLE